MEHYFEAPRFQRKVETPDLDAMDRGVHTPAYRHFFERITAGRTTDSDGEPAVQVMSLIDAMYLSASREGARVVLNPQEPEVS